jgi:peptide deformylase
MTDLALVPATDSILTTEIDNFNFVNPPVDPEELAQQLVSYMRDNNGIGLAANQVGLPYRVFVMEGEPAFACFNPKIVVFGDELVTLEEACLTFPKLYVKVKRAKSIKVRFTGPDGEVYTKTFTGMTARIFQHELDHLNGLHFYQRANSIHREQAFKKWKQAKRKDK